MTKSYKHHLTRRIQQVIFKSYESQSLNVIRLGTESRDNAANVHAVSESWPYRRIDTYSRSFDERSQWHGTL